MTNAIITEPNPEWFTTILTSEPDARVYPFFGTEDGDLIGLGHQDRDEFNEAVVDYWRETESGDPEITDVTDEVQHRWAVVSEGDPGNEDYAFWVSWYDERIPNRPPVTAETPGAVAITCVTF